LQNLEPNNELNPPTGVQFPRADAEKHAEVALLTRCILFEVPYVYNILILGFCVNSVFTFISSKAAQDKASFLFAADFDKPSGRFWHEPYDDEKNQERQNLKCDGESPDKGRCIVVIFGSTTTKALVTLQVVVSPFTYNSSQYATTTPKMFKVNSIDTNFPREV
jgi:hypothetical protein